MIRGIPASQTFPSKRLARLISYVSFVSTAGGFALSRLGSGDEANLAEFAYLQLASV
jgi:hypothetical protein